jgi:hypothetical protein
MSALPLKADIRLCNQHFRFVPITDIADLTRLPSLPVPRLGHRQFNCLGDLEVGDQFKSYW